MNATSMSTQDLHVMKQLGANTVRLYGNNPNQSHEGFLDEAHRQELKVVAGMSSSALKGRHTERDNPAASHGS